MDGKIDLGEGIGRAMCGLMPLSVEYTTKGGLLIRLNKGWTAYIPDHLIVACWQAES